MGLLDGMDLDRNGFGYRVRIEWRISRVVGDLKTRFGCLQFK